MADIRIDRDGLREVLKSNEVAKAVGNLAADVYDNVRAQGRTVDDAEIPGKAVTVPLGNYVAIGSHETDRAAASVTLAHPAGLGMQAVHGVLTIAATSAGLDVTES